MSPRESVSEAQYSEDTKSTASGVKVVVQELLRCGYVEEQRKPAMFRSAMTKTAEIASALEPLDLTIRLDEHRGVAYLAVAESAYNTKNAKNTGNATNTNITNNANNTNNTNNAHSENSEGAEWSHPLVRRQRLTLEQSLVIALLRQMYMLHEQDTGVGGSPAKIAVEELLPQFLSYLGDSGSDAKNRSRLMTLLDQLKTYGIVTEVDKNEELVIRPLIAHLANPESLKALLATLEAEAEATAPGTEGIGA